MAGHTGSEGTIKVGANAIGELRSYSLTEEAETIEKSAMGDSYRSFSVGMKSWSGSCEVFWDETDTAQTALVPGASATIEFYPEGASSGDTYYHGHILHYHDVHTLETTLYRSLHVSVHGYLSTTRWSHVDVRTCHFIDS